MTEIGSWVTVRVHPGSNRDAVIAALFESGAQGIQEVGESIVTQVASQALAEELEQAALAASSDAVVSTAPLPDVDWSEQWKQGIHAQVLGGLTVAPPWLAGDLDPESSIVIEPGMAFGTGEHATTRGVIRLMQTVVRPGDRVADLGSGSAVLAIAAAKLGARHASCVDIDPQALIATRDNATANEVGARVQVYEAADDLPRPVDFLVANILSGPLCQLAPSFAALIRPGGSLVLAGLMEHQAAEVAEAHSAWFDMRPFGKRDDWLGLSGRRRF